MTRDLILEEYRQYRDRRKDRSLTRHAVELAEGCLARLDGDLTLVTTTSARDAWLIRYVKQQQARSDRERPVCSCQVASCPLKRGEVPHHVREADSVSRGIFDFEVSHGGTPHVLVEARKEWEQKVDRVRHHIAIADAILRHGAEPAGPAPDSEAAEQSGPGEFPLPRGVEEEEALL